MKLFLKYVSSKRHIFLIFLLFAAVFAVSLKLYRLPGEAVIYPTALCFVFGSIFTVIRFLKYKKKHEILENIRLMKASAMIALPEHTGALEKDYRDIIEALREETVMLNTEHSAQLKDMTEYYSVWAHQIKTPIASMKLSLQNEDSPVSRKLSGDLLRIEQYVEMVLAFLRLDSPSSDYVFKVCSLDDILKKSVRKFASDFINKKLCLEYEPVGCSVVTDEKWLAFVLEQLLSNSLKYTSDGYVRIFTEREGVLCIEDTGIGIAPEDLPRVFEKGYTGFNGRKDNSSSGIGLYLCKRICDNLGVDISISSKVGDGTLVRLDFGQKSEK